jgi:aminoglycoside phosphotransferase (APT) family kinase protein
VTTVGPELSGVRDQLDWPRLSAHLSQALGTTGELVVQQFPNGSANLTYLLTMGEWTAVLRRPPFGTIGVGAHDMAREHRVLRALSPHYDRAPATYHFCADVEVIGAPFFLMEYRSGGEVIRDRMPDSFAGRPQLGSRVSSAFAVAVAEFHGLDPDAVGLGDLGRPEGFAERQLRGWQQRWQAVAPDDAALSGLVADVHRRLTTAVPQPQRVSLVHNDLKLDNCQFRAGDPDRVSSLFDWDMTTLGDPLCDLGVLLNYWPEDGEAGELARQLWPAQGSLGLAGRQWMADTYSRHLDLDLSDLGWYQALAAWKTAVQLRQLAARFERGETRDERMRHYADVVAVAAEMARALL